jgi:hypothetical protein
MAQTTRLPGRIELKETGDKSSAVQRRRKVYPKRFIPLRRNKLYKEEAA